MWSRESKCGGERKLFQSFVSNISLRRIVHGLCVSLQPPASFVRVRIYARELSTTFFFHLIIYLLSFYIANIAHSPYIYEEKYRAQVSVPMTRPNVNAQGRIIVLLLSSMNHLPGNCGSYFSRDWVQCCEHLQHSNGTHHAHRGIQRYIDGWKRNPYDENVRMNGFSRTLSFQLTARISFISFTKRKKIKEPPESKWNVVAEADHNANCATRT